MHATVGLLLALACTAEAFAPGAVPLTGARTAAVSAKGRVSLRTPAGSAAHLSPMALRKSSFAQTTFHVRSETELSAAVNQISMALKPGEKPIVIGLAADSGCGKSTFMRRVTALFGGECKLNDIGRETNTLISDMTTVICLDDFHSNDRAGRKVSGLTALDPRENDFDNMLRCVQELKEGKSVMKPIYNHVNGTLDEDEKIEPTPIIIFEGLHPFHDERVNALMDFRIYVDITPEVKFNWKVQRDHEERGHSIESIKESIEARKPDFDAHIDPQKNKADCVIQVLPTELAKDDKKHLKVEMIQVKGIKNFKPAYILDADGEMSWTPSGIDTKDSPGFTVFQKQTKWNGKDAVVLGMDGKYNNIKEMSKIEAAISDAAAKSAGEATSKMAAYEGQPGSNDGTGFLQTICALKVREVYEALSGSKVAA
jgi:phosphoribulokinase